MRANSTQSEKHQTNPTQDISSLKSFRPFLNPVKSFRPILNPVFTDAPTDAKKTTFAITSRRSFSLKAYFIAGSMCHSHLENQGSAKNKKHVLTTKSSGSANNIYIPSFSMAAELVALSHMILHAFYFIRNSVAKGLRLKNQKKLSNGQKKCNQIYRTA